MTMTFGANIFFLMILLLEVCLQISVVLSFTTSKSAVNNVAIGKRRSFSAATVLQVVANPLDDSSSSPKSSSTSSSTMTDVIYQRVIRPSSDSNGIPDMLFLGYLVEYLESHFKLPSQELPMIYETKMPEEGEKNFVLAWDSPLSPSSEATRMEVEVVGIFTDKKAKKTNSKGFGKPSQSPSSPSVPSMAMVVVKKSKSKSLSSLPPMMKNLFDDSEKKITKALDLGLNKFVAGKIKFDSSGSVNNSKTSQDHRPPNVKTFEEALQVEEEATLEAEMVDAPPAIAYDASDNRGNQNGQKKDIILDAQIVEDDEKPSTPQNKNKRKEREVKESNVSPQPPAPVDENEDFAVAAARRVQLAKKKKKRTMATTTTTKSQKVSDDEEYAIAAARKISLKVKNMSKKKKGTIPPKSTTATTTKNGRARGTSSTTTASQQQSRTIEEVQEQPMEVPKNFQASDFMGDERAFKQTISRPSDYLQRRKKKKTNTVSVGRSTSETKPKKKNQVVIEASTTKNENVKLTSSPKLKDDESTKNKMKSQKEMADMKKRIEKEHNKLNLKIVSDENDDGQEPEMSESSKEGESKSTPSRNDMEIEVMKAAEKVMDEIAEKGEDMTAEELLKDVLKFGEEKKKEEAPGSGFVSGAFEKANELMRERHAQRQRRLENQKQVKERIQTMNDVRPNIVDPTEISAEEELRQMFEAGERLADSRITTTQAGELATKPPPEGTTMADVDQLVAEEKSISSYAKVLDEELAELEITINKSPGEDLDGPVMKNPMFDIMSGPEVYDQNVDPDTVNYPGAMPGTKDIRLPKELDEAMKQSKFAVEILTNLRTEEEENPDGTTKERYFMGKKEFTSEQIQSLKNVVAEAVEIGLIQNPLDVAQERSQLQMIIDEMWNQPPERVGEIASNYKDVLLSENFVMLVKERLTDMADRDLDALRNDDERLKEPHEQEREILGQLVNYAQLLLKETRALGAELEAQQLEVVRSICKVAMDPSHATEEETAVALSDAVRDMRPLLDDMFVAYLKYAVAEEEARLARAGLLHDPEYNQWLFVLKIVQQGVYSEIAKTINRYIDHIQYVLRMETPQQRRKLLSRLIDDMPTMDVRPFVQVVENIAGSLGDGAKGDFDGVGELGDMTNVILQLRRDVHDLLPPERIALKARDADEWAAKQREKLMEARNATKKRLQAAKETEHLQDEIEALGRRGDVDKFD